MSAGADAAMFAWRRANVADLNRLARQRWAAAGHLTGPELAVPGGRAYAAGDRIVTLAPAADGRLVTSQTGTVVAVDPAPATLELRMDDGQQVRLPAGRGRRRSARLRLRPHRAPQPRRHRRRQPPVLRRRRTGARLRLHVPSPRQEALVYVVADDVDQAKGDLAQDWSKDRRQRWAIDTGTPTTAVAEIEHEPEAPSRLQAVIREARSALGTRRCRPVPFRPRSAPSCTTASRQLAALEARRHDLETGGPAYWQTPEGRAGAAVHRFTNRLET